MSKDRLLSDEELTNTLFATFFRLSGGMNNIATAEAGYLLDLINTQKRLYAESVIGEDDLPITIKNKYSQSQKNTRNELRAEQRASIHKQNADDFRRIK